MASSDISSIPTPAHCTADFCLIPIGTSSPSVSAQIADVQRLIEKSGLKYVMHSAGTTLEGPWDKVHQVIGQAHTVLHQQGIVRIQTDVRVGSRTDKEQSFEDKVNKVRQLLGKDAIVGGEGLFGYIPFLGDISRLLRTWHVKSWLTQNAVFLCPRIPASKSNSADFKLVRRQLNTLTW
ncbi:hypothetical protein AFLA_000431 [Aspergillus flavus NRRL3357]|nr:hypothetical protein AFLA_000431 [Aspergillus flavus NRRL3357]